MIERKREGDALSPEDLRAFLSGYVEGAVTEYQMSAFLMAVVFRGMEGGELSVLLKSMIDSGASLEWSHLPGPVVDKHSTGGVGDKVSLPLAPLAAAMGLFVPMMSGRGLGHTGGTLDKLESIPGFTTDLDLDRFQAVLAKVGCVMIGQTEQIAPLDRRLYDLRSVTGTVPCIPLIAASIMSKKLAEGLDGLVLDVKVGSGAFLPEHDRAIELANTMVDLGRNAGVRMTARLTAMDRPLGRMIGNSLEVWEAMECLRGEGPEELRSLVLELAAEMSLAGGLDTSIVPAKDRAARALDSGRALEIMEIMVAEQGGSVAFLSDRSAVFAAPDQVEVTAARAGVVQAIDPLGLGRGVITLGGGRRRLGETIDPRVGFELSVDVGQTVRAGQLLGRVHAATVDGAAEGAKILTSAVLLGEADRPGLPLFMERIGSPLVEEPAEL